MPAMQRTDDPIADTRLWLERAVIGLNLCPFAKAVLVKDQVRFVLSDATTPEALLEQLGEELLRLRSEFDQTLAGLQRGEGLGKVLGQPIRRGRKVTLGRPL